MKINFSPNLVYDENTILIIELPTGNMPVKRSTEYIQSIQARFNAKSLGVGKIVVMAVRGDNKETSITVINKKV